jgi:hypothetical protein
LSYNLDTLSSPSPMYTDAVNSTSYVHGVHAPDLATAHQARVLEAALVGVKRNVDFAFAPEPPVNDTDLRVMDAFMSAIVTKDEKVSRWAHEHSGLLPHWLNRWATTTPLLTSMLTYSAKVDDHSCFPSLNSVIAVWGKDDKRRLKAVFQILKEVQTRTNTDVHVIADLVSGSFSQTPASASNANAKWACIVLIENADKIGGVGGEEMPAPVMQYYDDDGSSSSSGPGEKKDEKLAEHVTGRRLRAREEGREARRAGDSSRRRHQGSEPEKKDEKPAEHVIQVDVDTKAESEPEKKDEKPAEHVIQVDDKASASESASESDVASEKEPAGV